MNGSHRREEHPVKKILVGVDGSPESRAAVDYASKLARETSRGLVLAYVAEPPLPIDLVPAQNDEELRLWAQKVLDGIASRTRRTGLEVETAVLSGPVAETLAEAALADGIDFVVVGHRDRGAVTRALLGSVADRLAQISPKPLLLVPESAHAA
jgi:nucleotide-binding universal stress UspA family protein